MTAIDAPETRPRAASHASPLRLGYLIDTLVTGGAERLVVTFAEEARRRPEVALTVFVLSDRGTYLRDELEAMGVDVVALPGRSIVDPRRFARLVRALRTRRIEVVHAHLASATTLGAFAARLLGLPLVATIHNVKPSAQRVSAVRRLLYRAALRLPRVRAVAVGQAVALAARSDTGRRGCVVVPNAVPASARAPDGARVATRAELGLDADAVALACVGAIIGQKAHEVLLAAFAEVAARDRRSVLLCVGDARDPDRQQRLEAQAEALGVADRVRFLGLRRDVGRVLAASDVFVSASDWEGAPVSLLEAMANGLPSVVTDVGDTRLVLEGTGSILVPPRDPAALAAGIVAMIGDPERRARAGAAAAARALGDYGVAAWVDRLLDLYAEAGRADWRTRVTG